MARSRVFILYSHGLFARGVHSLLAREQEVEVVGVERDDRLALEKIRMLHPDVILVDSRRGGSPCAAVGQENGCLTVSEIFQETSGARVISLDLRENGIDVYDKQRIITSGPEDLVRAIRRGGDGQEWGIERQEPGEESC